jgi:hypothetical protein
VKTARSTVNNRALRYVSLSMRIAVAVIVLVLVAAARPSDACVQLPEANKLLGWSEDGKFALFARVGASGKLSHAEIHPTRYEGHRYVILEESGAIVVKRELVSKCEVTQADEHARFAGGLTEAALMKLPVVKALGLVPVPTDDGGAGTLTAKFVPNKRYAEHKLELRDATNKVAATLSVPVWCVGSCLRDEAFATWTAEVKTVAKAGDRTLYVLRMRNVCNAANDKDLWMDRVIAVSGTEKPPAKGRCRGSGG